MAPVHLERGEIMDKERKRECLSYMEMYDSLYKAITEAGGAPPTIKKLEKMDVFDLLTLLAPNNIRFVFVEKGRDAQEISSHCLSKRM